MEIKFDLRTEGDALPDAYLDSAELALMFESTRRSIGDGLQRKFRDVLCEEHGQAPKFRISGVFDRGIEDMDVQYHVDTCCQVFLLRVMQILNRRG